MIFKYSIKQIVSVYISLLEFQYQSTEMFFLWPPLFSPLIFQSLPSSQAYAFSWLDLEILTIIVLIILTSFNCFKLLWGSLHLFLCSPECLLYHSQGHLLLSGVQVSQLLAVLALYITAVLLLVLFLAIFASIKLLCKKKIILILRRLPQESSPQWPCILLCNLVFTVHLVRWNPVYVFICLKNWYLWEMIKSCFLQLFD